MNDTTPAEHTTGDDVRDMFHAAAKRVAASQMDRLTAAWHSRTGEPVSDDLRTAFRNIIWQCNSATVDTLVHEFTAAPKLNT